MGTWSTLFYLYFVNTSFFYFEAYGLVNHLQTMTLDKTSS